MINIMQQTEKKETITAIMVVCYVFIGASIIPFLTIMLSMMMLGGGIIKESSIQALVAIALAIPVLQLMFGLAIKKVIPEGVSNSRLRRVYIVMLWVAFLIFLAILRVITTMFLPAMTGTMISEGGAEGVPGAAGVSLERYSSQLYHILLSMAMVKGLGDGVLIGLLSRGKITSGVKHALPMLLLSLVVLYLLL